MMDIFKYGGVEWQSCGFYKSNESIEINYELPNVWPRFRTIEKSDFAMFYYRCCLNLVAANEHIEQFKGGSGHKLTNELAHTFRLGPRKGVCFETTNVNLNYLVMLAEPKTFQNIAAQDKSEFVQYAINNLRTFFQKNKESKRVVYSEKDFAAIIIEYIMSNSTLRYQFYLILDQQEFVKRITLLVDDFLKGKESLDYELIRTLIEKIESVLDEYNNDFKLLGLGLSHEAKSLAHKIAFFKSFDFFTEKLKSRAYVARDLWVSKRDELRQLFVSKYFAKTKNT